ncbi:hypothetical protein M5F00_02755 [Acinetobacter sp. ANC 4945]|uniref:Iron transporter n=1 Tax=Acinetobacter amyesii TaxID=2942470 RepID=A0A1T1GYP9_9GAMM|nr:hypothetical protein [Acinetobacter amyesii]MCL6246792.1 hypothetical protein [Acinetobacter amyesii]OOV82738.1 hypothetical protein B1202_09820 [Acinetobacter amyesii]
MNSSPPEALVTPLTSALPKTRKDTPSLLTYRLMIFYRFALALVGGYVVAMLSAIVIADVFSEDRGSAAMSATLIAFILWSCAFIWVFMVNKALKATLGIVIPAVCLYAIYMMMGS